MAAEPGGLTTKIRRQLQEGKTPDEIVQDLVAGGLGKGSAQRFVDRALLEDAASVPLPPVTAAPAQADALDQFIQTKTAETEAETAKTGQKSLWVASALMCGGILITGISFIMADEGEQFTLMWGPVVFGFFLWGKSVLGGLANVRSFAWFSAIGSLAAPVVLAVLLLGVAVAGVPMEEDVQASSTPEVEVPALVVNAENLTEVLGDYTRASSTREKCELADVLSRFNGEGRPWLATELSNRVEDLSPVQSEAKICTAKAIMTLDTATGVRLYEYWRKGSNPGLKKTAEMALENAP